MTQVLRVGVLCETSGAMRRAFAALGHDATSVDRLPAEDGSNHHIVGDVRDYLDYGWDLLIVCHPPCTRLCNSGVRWLSDPPKNPPADATPAEKVAWPILPREARLAIMWRLLDEGAELFAACWQAPVARVAVENPVMHKHGRARMPADLPKPQIVQPWWFDEPAFKATGFYLRGLPPLTATKRLIPPKAATEPERHKAWSAIHRASPGPDRWKIRSRTFEGIARACAEQWGGYALDQIRRRA
ncbi:hypothetical protein [Paracoccus pantotrophus]|uniref:hypothetical protein n=1 Tax=Paracoccus pantotrophus TaxID=82367 RepID=UPI0035B04DFD